MALKWRARPSRRRRCSKWLKKMRWMGALSFPSSSGADHQLVEVRPHRPGGGKRAYDGFFPRCRNEIAQMRRGAFGLGPAFVGAVRPRRPAVAKSLDVGELRGGGDAGALQGALLLG